MHESYLFGGTAFSFSDYRRLLRRFTCVLVLFILLIMLDEEVHDTVFDYRSRHSELRDAIGEGILEGQHLLVRLKNLSLCLHQSALNIGNLALSPR